MVVLGEVSLYHARSTFIFIGYGRELNRQSKMWPFRGKSKPHFPSFFRKKRRLKEGKRPSAAYVEAHT